MERPPGVRVRAFTDQWPGRFRNERSRPVLVRLYATGLNRARRLLVTMLVTPGSEMMYWPEPDAWPMCRRRREWVRVTFTDPVVL